MTQAECLVLAVEVSATLDNDNVARVVYTPGDSTRYDVVFARVDGTLYAAVVNMGGAYVLGDGWKHWTYVQEHWSGRNRLGAGSAAALANLFNAVAGSYE